MYPIGELLQEKALAILDGESTGIFLVMDLMTLIVLPSGITLMLGSVIALPIYLVYLMTQIPRIIHCWGRLGNPDYPECGPKNRRSRSRTRNHLPNLNRGHAGEDIVAVDEGKQGSDGSSQLNVDEFI